MNASQLIDQLFAQIELTDKLNISFDNLTPLIMIREQRHHIASVEFNLLSNSIELVSSPMPDGLNSFQLLLALRGLALGKKPDEINVVMIVNNIKYTLCSVKVTRFKTIYLEPMKMLNI